MNEKSPLLVFENKQIRKEISSNVYSNLYICIQITIIDNALVVFSWRLKEYRSVYATKLLGCLSALEYIHAHVQRSWITEVNVHKVYNALTARDEDDSEYDFIIVDRRTMLKLRTDVSIKWVTRQCNTVVHEIIKTVLLYPKFHFWESLTLNIVVLLF